MYAYAATNPRQKHGVTCARCDQTSTGKPWSHEGGTLHFDPNITTPIRHWESRDIASPPISNDLRGEQSTRPWWLNHQRLLPATVDVSLQVQVRPHCATAFNVIRVHRPRVSATWIGGSHEGAKRGIVRKGEIRTNLSLANRNID